MLQVHELRNLKKAKGIIFEVYGKCARVMRYGAPYGEYIVEEILSEETRLWEYVRHGEDEESVSMGELVRRAALEICPNEKDVYFEIML